MIVAKHGYYTPDTRHIAALIGPHNEEEDVRKKGAAEVLEGKAPFQQTLWIACGRVCGLFLSMDIFVHPAYPLHGATRPSRQCT